METGNAKQVLSNLYGLLMEMTLCSEDEDVMSGLTIMPDTQIEKHLVNIRKLTAKYKAHSNRMVFHQALTKLRELKEKGSEEMLKLFNTQEQSQLLTLFRKFDENSARDDVSLMEDELFMDCMNLLKSKLDESEQ